MKSGCGVRLGYRLRKQRCFLNRWFCLFCVTRKWRIHLRILDYFGKTNDGFKQPDVNSPYDDTKFHCDTDSEGSLVQHI